MRRPAIAAALLVVAASIASAADFRQIGGDAIRVRFAGMALTDHVHWRYVFRRDGSLPSTALGRERLGAWRVEGDRLCMRQGPGLAECYAVWIAGSRIELRPENDALPTEEGSLERP